MSFEAQVLCIREAIWTCCNSWSENNRQAFTLTKLKIWDWRIRKTTPDGYSLAIAEFRNYVLSGRAFPSMPDPVASSIADGESAPEPNGRALGAPLLASLINFVAAHGVRREFESVFDFPYSLAAWLYFCEMESQGRIKIENAKEREVKMELDQAKAEALAEELAAKNNPSPNAGLATPPPDLSEHTEEGNA